MTREERKKQREEREIERNDEHIVEDCERYYGNDGLEMARSYMGYYDNLDIY